MCIVAIQLCSYKNDASLAVKPSFDVLYAVIRYTSFVAICVYGLAVYVHNFVSGAVALQLDLSCNSKPHKNVSNSRAVIQYAERPYITCSFQLMHVRRHKWLIRKKLRWVFGTITHQSYFASSSNTEVDISDSKTVIWYVPCCIQPVVLKLQI